MEGRKGNIKIQQTMRRLMATLKIIHAAIPILHQMKMPFLL
jgi:hypothetical protein